MQQFIAQGVQKLVLRKLLYNLAFLNQKTCSHASGNADIRFLCLSGAVDVYKRQPMISPSRCF